MSKAMAPAGQRGRVAGFVGRSSAASLLFLLYAALLWVLFQLSQIGSQCYYTDTCDDGLASVADIGIVVSLIATLIGIWFAAHRVNVRGFRAWPVWILGYTLASMCFYAWAMVKGYALQTPSWMIF
ncbi:hypothetical protein [Microbacterium sp. ZW T5_56]|uniref:hypothetical protein n=1 Tax=Microbacterium sp. ZW T5_56 TaxID=3378081 RepID=UPI003851DCBC